MGISQLTGTPWHIETLRTNDERRHMAKCGYYRNGYCYCYYENCHGSARCDAYNVNAVIPAQTDSSVPSKEHQPLKKEQSRKHTRTLVRYLVLATRLLNAIWCSVKITDSDFTKLSA